MALEQKERVLTALGTWHSSNDSSLREYQAIELMAALLQELVDAPEAEPVLVVETEPGYWNRGHYYEGTKSYIDPTKVWGLPAGTKLYAAPPAPSVPCGISSLFTAERKDNHGQNENCN